MNRTIIAAAVLLLSTGAGLAAGIVPGSDTGVPDDQSAEDMTVATGFYGAPAGEATAYGYPARNDRRTPARASDAADDRAVDRAARSAPTTPRSALVPASDSF